MTTMNKILDKPSGRGMGISIGDKGAYYPLTGSIAFLRDDFSASSVDTDEWDATSAPMTGTGSYYVSAGTLVVDLGTSSTGTFTMTSKDSFQIPFRVAAAISVDGIGTAMEAILRVKDSGGTWLAEWLMIGSAGGTEHTASTRVRAGSTAAGYIGSLAVDPSAVVAVAGSAYLGYVIDLDFSGITFAMPTSGGQASGVTAIPQVPSVRTHFISPVLHHRKPYYVEFSVRSGTAVEAAGAANSAANGSALIRVDWVDVKQYAPDAVFQHKSNVTQVYSATTGTGATAMIGLTQLKWG